MADVDERGVSAREQARIRLEELGEWLRDHAGVLTAEMSEVLLERDGVTVNADIRPNGVTSVTVVKNYIVINR